MTETIDLDELQKDAIRRIARHHGAMDVRVFGSRSTGKSNVSSDIDLLVELEPGRDLLDLIAIKQDLEEELGCAVDVVTRNGLNPYLKDRILSEARSL
jgi:predicted nucleotidyltransferase